MNLMTVDGCNAKIEYDSKIDLFCGEILGLNGGTDFYGDKSEEPRREVVAHWRRASTGYLWRRSLCI
jgi:predicted HicB family RNase H-like nuclease